MSPHVPTRLSTVWPGPGRITLVLLAVVPAAMAYPWQSTRQRCLLGVAVVVVIVLLSRWRGLYLTTITRRRLALTRRRGQRLVPQPGTDESGTAVTTLLQITPAGDADELPLALIARYTARYGLTAAAIRITSHDTVSESGSPRRDTWIGLTLSAVENLPALQARSPRIPLHETAEVALRRLADHLRENGWTATAVAHDDVFELLAPTATESWHGVCRGSADYIAAYQVDVNDALPDTLAAVWSYPAREVWTVLEIAPTATGHVLAVGCALRTDGQPGAAPLTGLIPQRGNHLPALKALHPLSTKRLDGPSVPADDLLERLHWASAEPSTARHAIRT